MSFIDDSPYLKTLKYWSDKLSDRNLKSRFLATKCFEFLAYNHGKYFGAFKSHKNESLETELKQIPPADRSKIAVIIPFHVTDSSGKYKIQRLFESLKKQTIQPSLVVAVDDYSPLQIEHPDNIATIRLSAKSGAAKARNTGLKLALKNGCGIIAFTDSDCLADTAWIETIRNSFLSMHTHLLSGMTKSFGNTWFDKYHDINGTLNGRKFSDNTLLYGPTCNFAISADLAANIRFSESFPTASGEDIEFCIQAISKGFKITHNNKMIIYHDYGYKTKDLIYNLSLFFRQFSRYAGSQKILVEKAPHYFDLFNQTLEITET